MNALILMAKKSINGDCSEYLRDVNGLPLIEQTLSSLKEVADSITCVIRKEDQDNVFLGDTIKVMCPKCNIIETPGDTKGALCSALFAIDNINNDNELTILDGDVFINIDKAEIVNGFRKDELDVGITSICAIHPKYSSVLTDNEGYIIQASEKKPISNIALAGMTYFKHGSDFVSSAMAVIEKDANVNGLYYISSSLNEMVLKHKRMRAHIIAQNTLIKGEAQ